MNVVFAGKDTQQKIDELKLLLTENHKKFQNGEIDHPTYQQKEKEMLASLEQLFIIKNTQGII